MVDFITFGIVLILMGAFCTPFIYAHIKKTQQEKQLVQSFYAQAKEHQLHIHVHELWRRTYIIGLDKDLLQLMYIKYYPSMQMRIVDLKKIKTARIVNEQRLVGADKQAVTDHLALLLIHEDQGLTDIYLEFFNAAEKDDLSGEPTVIHKWHNLLEVTINGYQKTQTKKELYPGEVGRRVAGISDQAVP